MEMGGYEAPTKVSVLDTCQVQRTPKPDPQPGTNYVGNFLLLPTPTQEATETTVKKMGEEGQKHC